GGRATTPAGFRGFGRSATDSAGNYRIVTLRPGPLPSPDGGTEAPHLDVSVFARGLLDRVVTRIYFSDEVQANAADPVLSSIADAERRATLIAVAAPGEAGSGDDAGAGDGAGGGRRLPVDVRLQGEPQAVFFAVLPR